MLQVGTFDVNCAVLSDGAKAWIVDPGMEADRIAAALCDEGLEPEAILLTHAHFDHVGAVPALQAKWPELPVYMHPDDEKVLVHPLNSFPPDYPPIPAPSQLRDIRQLEGVRGLVVIHTPGHTPGCVCLHFPKEGLLLSGDTLFAGSIGRTDLPGGNFETIMTSLRSIVDLPDRTVVVPGHGAETTIGAEKSSNPYLRFA